MIKNKTFQIKLSHLIIGGIFLLLLIFLLKCNITPTVTNTYNKEKREIDSLKIKITEFKKFNIVLDSKINKQQKVIDSLDIKILNTKKELTKTRIYHDNKIKNINSSSPSELSKFFTERYK